jgi:hypothetical protein
MNSPPDYLASEILDLRSSESQFTDGNAKASSTLPGDSATTPYPEPTTTIPPATVGVPPELFCIRYRLVLLSGANGEDFEQWSIS